MKNMTVLSDEAVVLVCDVKPKNAVLAIVWTKGDETVIESERIMFGEQSLIIKRVIQSDVGYYTCSIKTSSGNLSKTAFLTVMKQKEIYNDGRYLSSLLQRKRQIVFVPWQKWERVA